MSEGIHIKKNDYVTSPKGSLLYVNITGQGKENYDGDGYDYVATVDVPKKEAKLFMSEIDEFLEDNQPSKSHKLRSLPYRTHKDSDKIPKDMVRFNFKTQTTFESGDTRKINLFNHKNERVSLPDGTKIGNGSVGLISGKITIYTGKKDYGATLWLNGIQILKFEEYIEDSGFEEQDDGDFENFDTNLEPGVEEKKEKKKKKKKKS